MARLGHGRSQYVSCGLIEPNLSEIRRDLGAHELSGAGGGFWRMSIKSDGTAHGGRILAMCRRSGAVPEVSCDAWADRMQEGPNKSSRKTYEIFFRCPSRLRRDGHRRALRACMGTGCMESGDGEGSSSPLLKGVSHAQAAAQSYGGIWHTRRSSRMRARAREV